MKNSIFLRAVILKRGILFLASLGMIFFMLFSHTVDAEAAGKYGEKDFDYTVEVVDCTDDQITYETEIENKGENFEGVFRMVFKTAGWRYYITYYDTELTLPSGGKKSFQISIPTTSVWPDDISYVKYQLVSVSGEIVDLAEDSDLMMYLSSSRNVGGSYFAGEMEDPMNYLNGDMHPLHGLSIILLVLLFVVLAGPIGYLILAKNKKRDFYWILVPVLSLLFILFIFLAGGNYRLTGLNMISVRMIDGQGQKDDHISFMAYNAAASDWEMEFAEDIYSVGAQSSDYRYDYDERKGDLAVINNGRSTRLAGYPSETFHECYGNALAPKTGTAGCFTVNDVDTNRYGEVSGTLVNNTGKNIEVLFVAIDSNVYVLEGVKAGATVALEDLKVKEYRSYSRDYEGWLDEVKYSPAFHVTDQYVADSDNNVTVVYGIVEGGPSVCNGKVKESSYCVYYAVD